MKSYNPHFRALVGGELFDKINCTAVTMDFNIYSVKFKRNMKITPVDRPMQPGQGNVHWIPINLSTFLMSVTCFTAILKATFVIV